MTRRPQPISDRISGLAMSFTQRLPATTLAAVALTVLLLIRVGASVVSSDGLHWDFSNFYSAGARIFHGEQHNLYVPGAPIAGKPPLGSGRLNYTGFPLSAYLLAPFGAFPARQGLFFFKAACAMAFALGLLVLFRDFRRVVDPPWPIEKALSLYLLIVLLFEPFWFVFRVGGQTTAFGFLFLALFVHFYVEDRPWLSAIALALAILTKTFLAPAALVLFLARDWRFLARLAVCFLTAAALSWLLFGTGLHLEWLQTIRGQGSRWAIRWWNNASPISLLTDFWLHDHRDIWYYPPMPRVLRVLQELFRISLVEGAFYLV
jgi:hypothetical protein